jgi:uncharacterized glyoxalase superfamily protein PhnB
MKNTPKGWPRMSSAIFYQDAGKAIDWLTGAFGFEVRIKVEGDNGRIEHSELVFGDGLIMVASENPRSSQDGQRVLRSPKSLGGASTQSVMVFVDDAEAHCLRARAAGATIFDEPKVHDYGEDYWADKSYGATDPEGHHWWFTQRVRDPKS